MAVDTYLALGEVAYPELGHGYGLEVVGEGVVEEFGCGAIASASGWYAFASGEEYVAHAYE